ncbi:hypothetical protein BG004_008143 [Podila humilis]|nr:hypothetical protein BG004_008143 [Podila humilis]
MDTSLPAGWIAYYDNANRRYFFVETSTGISQWEDPRTRDTLPPYHFVPPPQQSGVHIYPPTTTAVSSNAQTSTAVGATAGGLPVTFGHHLKMPETVISEEANGRYANYGKKKEKYSKKKSFKSDSDSDDSFFGSSSRRRKERKNKAKKEEDKEDDGQQKEETEAQRKKREKKEKDDKDMEIFEIALEFL